MPDPILAAIQAGLFVSTIALMFAQGTSIPLSYLAFFKEHPGLLQRSLLAVIVLVPAAVVLVILLVGPSPAVAVGLAILAACPAAPAMVVNIPKAGGRLAYAASLHLVLGLLSLVTTPLTLALLSAAVSFHASVSPYAIAEQVGTSLIIPLLLGMLFLAMFPRAAVSIRMPLALVGQAISYLSMALIFVTNYYSLLQMDIRSYTAMALMIIIALAIGHVLAPREPEERTTLALETAGRHPGMALLIASLNFPLEKALPVLIPYVVIFAVISLIYIRIRKRTSSRLRFARRSISR